MCLDQRKPGVRWLWRRRESVPYVKDIQINFGLAAIAWFITYSAEPQLRNLQTTIFCAMVGMGGGAS